MKAWAVTAYPLKRNLVPRFGQGKSVEVIPLVESRKLGKVVVEVVLSFPRGFFLGVMVV